LPHGRYQPLNLETEPESDEEDLAFGNAAKGGISSVGFPRKRAGTESATGEMTFCSMHVRQLNISWFLGDDSATEPDPDEDLSYVPQEGSATANPNAPPLALKQVKAFSVY
jgi:hypothetical protein